MKIGKMIPEKITRVWRKEDKNFTPWLADNIQVLSDALGFELRGGELYKPTGKT